MNERLWIAQMAQQWIQWIVKRVEWSHKTWKKRKKDDSVKNRKEAFSSWLRVAGVNRAPQRNTNIVSQEIIHCVKGLHTSELCGFVHSETPKKHAVNKKRKSESAQTEIDEKKSWKAKIGLELKSDRKHG